MTFLAQYDVLLKTFCIYTVFGLSMQVVLKSGVFSLASAGFWGVSAYMTGILAKQLPEAIWAIFLLGPLASIVLAVILSSFLHKLKGLYLGMATIAFALLVVAIASNWKSVTGGSLGLYAIPQAMTVPIAILITLVCIGLVALFHAGASGRFADALNIDEPLAMMQGISTRKLRMATFGFSGFLGAVSGAMYSLTFGTLSPTTSGFSLVVLGLTMAVIGGSSSWVGAVLGAVVVTVLPQLLGFVNEWRDLVYGAIVVVMMVFAPNGLLGLWSKARARMLGGRRPSTSSRSTRNEKAVTINA